MQWIGLGDSYLLKGISTWRYSGHQLNHYLEQFDEMIDKIILDGEIQQSVN